jgi:hypothetical protein
MKRSGEIKRFQPLSHCGLLGAPDGHMPAFSGKKVRQGWGRKRRWEREQERLRPVVPVILKPAPEARFVDRVKRFMRKLFR